jgi:hypothetical protein
VVDQLLTDPCLGLGAPALRDVADPPAHGHRLAADVVAGHQSRPGGGLEQRREHPLRRRLAGPVGAQEADELPSLDVQINAADGLDRPTPGSERPRQPMRLDHLGSLLRQV